MSDATPEVLVLGASIAGLSTALFLHRRGLQVRVLDADPAAAVADVDEAARRDVRWTTPQAAHSHAFLARGLAVLRAEAPDVLDALVAAGAPLRALEPPATVPEPRPEPDPELVTLAARRTTFEAVLRRVVAAEVEVRVGVAATGLRFDHRSSTPRVVGVDTDDGATHLAPVVIDATGRRGKVHRWLGDADIAVDDRDADCGIAYHSRFHRLHIGAAPGPLGRGFTGGGSFDRYSCLVFPGDDDTFSVTFGVLPEDKALRGLRTEEGFAAAAARIEPIAPWVDPARSTPISGVSTMTRMRNRVRRTVVDGRPTVTGIVSVADAAAISNPAHSRGCSLALAHAQAVADAVATHLHDPLCLARTADQSIVDVLLPWVADSERQDRARLANWRGDDATAEAVFPSRSLRLRNGEAYLAAQHDPYVWERFTRLQQLLELPGAVLDDEEVVRRTRAVQTAGASLPSYAAPSHEELAELLTRTTDRSAA